MSSSSAATPSAGGSSTTDKEEMKIVTEVPPSLHKALLMMTKNFYEPEQYLLVYYIMRAVCIREENLKNKVHFDQRALRQYLAKLKLDKLVKERLLSQKNDNGRTVSIIFYFINYRAIINVLKYKIDHMRQRLEAKEKEDVQKAVYRCESCGSQYETLEVDRIYDHSAGILRCWRCQGEVSQDNSGGPTQTTRSLLAKFNEQMLPLYAAIRELSGIQLAPHLLEPDINLFLAEDQKHDDQQQLVDFSQPGDKAGLGGKAYLPTRGANIIKYAQGDQITVDLNADINSKPMEEAKQVPAWLQDDAIGGAGLEHAKAAEALAVDSFAKEDGLKPSAVTLSLLAELEGGMTSSLEPPEKRVKTEVKVEVEDADGERNGEDEDDYDEEEEDMVEVQGKSFPLSEVTPEMVGTMTDGERAKYVELVQANMGDY